VLAAFTCADPASGLGILTCSGSVASGRLLDTSRPGVHTFTVTATSLDGQVTTKIVSYTVLRPRNHFPAPPRLKTLANGDVIVTVEAPRPGVVNIMETAWDDNLARIAVLLQPGPRRFVFARAHVVAKRAGMMRILVKPNARGRQLVAHHTYRVTLRLWISYTPTPGRASSTTSATTTCTCLSGAAEPLLLLAARYASERRSTERLPADHALRAGAFTTT
jgi:hypothetical protein